MQPATEYYDVFSIKNKLNGSPIVKESFDSAASTPSQPPISSMLSDISTSQLKETRKKMMEDSKSDYSTNVSNPHGYGYISSLSEVRNNDAKEIQEQETTVFALAAVTGVSFIVLGLLLASSSDISPTVSQ